MSTHKRLVREAAHLDEIWDLDGKQFKRLQNELHFAHLYWDKTAGRAKAHLALVDKGQREPTAAEDSNQGKIRSERVLHSDLYKEVRGRIQLEFPFMKEEMGNTPEEWSDWFWRSPDTSRELDKATDTLVRLQTPVCYIPDENPLLKPQQTIEAIDTLAQHDIRGVFIFRPSHKTLHQVFEQEFLRRQDVPEAA